MDMKQFTSLNPVADFSPQFAALLGPRQRPKNAAFGQKQGASTGWYRINNLSENDVEVFIYDEIGEFGGITADDFVKEFSEIKASNITVRINSRGGVVWDAFPIFNAIRRHKAHVTTIIDGIAASSASFIAMAGNEVVMSPHAQILIHNAHGEVRGEAEADDLRDLADKLDKVSDNIASVYANKTGGTVEEWRALMNATTLFSDAEAVEAGLADRIDGEDAEDAAARAAADANDHAGTREPAPIDILHALQKGTGDVVRKEPTLPDFNWLEGVKEAVAV